VKIKAKKSLGQNFLIDNNIIKKITDVTNILDNEILEVGPGSGNLTEQILKKKNQKNFLLSKKTKIFVLFSEINSLIE